SPQFTSCDIALDRDQETPRVECVAVPQPPRLLAQPPRPLQSALAHPNGGALLGSGEKVEAGTYTQRVAVAQPGAMAVDPDFGFGRADAKEQMRRAVRPNACGKVVREDRIVLETVRRHREGDLRPPEAARDEKRLQPPAGLPRARDEKDQVCFRRERRQQL